MRVYPVLTATLLGLACPALAAPRDLGLLPASGVVTFHKLSDAQTRVTVQLDWEPQGILEKLGSVTGVSTHAVKDELQHFKTYIEQQGTEDGAWRGDVQSG